MENAGEYSSNGKKLSTREFTAGEWDLQKSKERIEYHQEKQKQRVTEPGKPFEIGQLVRRKLQHSERRKLGKMAPYKSPRYRVIDRKGCT